MTGVSELPEGVPPARAPEPSESACGILLRRDRQDGWSALLGVRSRAARFMPGHHAFPGGRLEATDRPDEGGAHRRCVARELAEETGISVPPAEWSEVGERVTPPMFPMRFRTLFFLARLPDSVSDPAPSTPENERIDVLPPREVLDAWQRGKARIPPPVIPILRAIDAAGHGGFEDVVRAVRATNDEEQLAPRIEFVPGVWMLPVRTETLAPATHTNVWIPGEKRFAIVDPGSSETAEIERLLRVVERRARAGGDPAMVLLTHHHRDHVSGAAAVARALNVPLRAHQSVLAELSPELGGLESQPLAEDEVLDLGGERLEVHPSPGHAPGHLAFHLPRRRALIAGDMVSGFSTILVDPSHGDMGAYLASLERLQALDCKMLLPGHGPALPAKELQRVIVHRREREARVLESLAAGTAVALDELAESAYPDAAEAPPALKRGQALAHLLLLERQGRVLRADPAGASWRLCGEAG